MENANDQVRYAVKKAFIAKLQIINGIVTIVKYENIYSKPSTSK